MVTAVGLGRVASLPTVWTLVMLRRRPAAIGVAVVRPGFTLVHGSPRHCQLIEVVTAVDLAARREDGLRCHVGARLLAPDPEGLGAGAPIPGGGHQVPSRRTEVAIDHGVG